MLKIAGDTDEPTMVRIMAAKSALPFARSPMPAEATVSHSHLHAHAEMDSDAIRKLIADRLDRLAASRAEAPPVLDAAPAPALLEPEVGG